MKKNYEPITEEEKMEEMERCWREDQMREEEETYEEAMWSARNNVRSKHWNGTEESYWNLVANWTPEVGYCVGALPRL